MKKNLKKETRHLVAGTDAKITICGRPVGKVLLWAKKSAPGDEDKAVCNRCKTLQTARRRTDKLVAKHEAIRAAGKPTVAEGASFIREHFARGQAVLGATEKKAPPTTGKRQPALLVLGEKMPVHLQVTFKGKEHHASVNPDGTIAVDGHGQTYNSPSRAGKAVAGREVDGWTFWSYLKPNGDLEKIDALRKAVA
jgi:hypothetical protein